MWRFKNIQRERLEAFEDRWEQTRSLLCLQANLSRDPKMPAFKPEDFVRLSYDKTDTQINLHDNPKLLEEFKKRFKANKKNKRG